MNTYDSFSANDIFQNLPVLGLLLLPNTPDFTIIDITNELLSFTNIPKENIIGKNLFDVYTANEAEKYADGVEKLRSSLETVIATRQPHRMKVQRYDVKNSTGNFEEFYWIPYNKPVLNSKGEISYILHITENVTEKILHEKKIKSR